MELSNLSQENVLNLTQISVIDISPGCVQNPDKFQFKFSVILCLLQRLLLESEKAWYF